ncbi:MAG TPA: RNA polymerase sigma factor [bacterium]|mgnify:CR=1 FL=1|nr:RNA polymerase sigma factor [bacterium]
MLLTDEQLISQCGQGSLPAFELLIRRWDKRILQFIYRCVGCRDEAEDLRQELFLKIYQQRKSFRPNGNFQAWLYKIATNLIIDKWVRKKRPLLTPLDDLPDGNLAPWHSSIEGDGRRSASAREIQVRIHTALLRLPPEERMVLILRHYENLPFKEIAELVQTPESTVKTRVYRALHTLRHELKELGVAEMDCVHAAWPMEEV